MGTRQYFVVHINAPQYERLRNGTLLRSSAKRPCSQVCAVGPPQGACAHNSAGSVRAHNNTKPFATMRASTRCGRNARQRN
eukprot:12551042-Alexandrium_andersonii.AAC.1